MLTIVFIPRPPTPTSNYYTYPFGQDTHVEEHMLSNTGSSPFFNVSEVYRPTTPDLPWSLHSSSMYSLEPPPIDAEFSASPGPTGWFPQTPPEGTTITITASPSSSAPVQPCPHISRLDDAIVCRWVDHAGVACNQLINQRDIGSHLRGSHGIRSNSRTVVCRWQECSRFMQGQALVRHITERHLGMHQENQENNTSLI